MRRWHVMVAALAFLFTLSAPKAEAQVSFGPQAVLFDFDELGLGARVDVGLGDVFGIEDGAFADLFGLFTGTYVFVSPGSIISFDANVAVPFDIDAGITPYAGAGINLIRTSIDIPGFGSASDTSGGLHLLGGLFFDLGDLPAWVQLGYFTTHAGGLNLSAGVLFGG